MSLYETDRWKRCFFIFIHEQSYSCALVYGEEESHGFLGFLWDLAFI